MTWMDDLIMDQVEGVNGNCVKSVNPKVVEYIAVCGCPFPF